MAQGHMMNKWRLKSKLSFLGNSLMVQWLRLCASTVGDTDLIPG